MTVVDLVRKGVVTDIRPGDAIVYAGATWTVTSAERQSNPLKLVVGGPRSNTAVAIQLTFENGETAIVHPQDSVSIIRR